MEGLITMDKRVYEEDFHDWIGLCRSFGIDPLREPEPNLVFARYADDGNCGGLADVAFCRDGNWFYVCASHCSCYGLEDQWDPEQFDPLVYFDALAAGRHLLSIKDKKFDVWLAEATTLGLAA